MAYLRELPNATKVTVTPAQAQNQVAKDQADGIKRTQQLKGQANSGTAGSGAGSGYVAQPVTYSYSVSGYDPSSDAAYQRALQALQSAYNDVPSYSNSYDAQIQDIYDKIMNRDKFSYDLSGDAMFQSYKENYINQGRLAMMDTMGQAAALTGGYGSSYSQAVGQQQYNAYLQNLNQLVPEFYDRAYQRYQNEGQDLYNQFNLTKDLSDTEYAKYRDQVSDYWNRLNYLASREDSAYNRGATEYWNTTNANMENYWNSVSAQQSAQKMAASASKSSSEASAEDNSSKTGLTYTQILSNIKSAKVSLSNGVNSNESKQATKAKQARMIDYYVGTGDITTGQAESIMNQLGISLNDYDKWNGYK